MSESEARVLVHSEAELYDLHTQIKILEHEGGTIECRVHLLRKDPIVKVGDAPAEFIEHSIQLLHTDFARERPKNAELFHRCVGYMQKFHPEYPKPVWGGGF